MNSNRVIIGLTVAVIVALVLSVYVYRAFQQASAVKQVSSQQIVVAKMPLMHEEMIEYICTENNKDVQHIVGKEGVDAPAPRER